MVHHQGQKTHVLPKYALTVIAGQAQTVFENL
jgi:hypothetical protein